MIHLAILILLIANAVTFEANYSQIINSLQISSSCRKDLISLFIGVSISQPWALKIIDSWGKINSGILEGNVFSLGSFDECFYISTHWDKIYNKSFIFQRSQPVVPHYCRADFDIGYNPLKEEFHNASLNYDKARKHEIIPIILRAPGLFYYQGWCLPSSCDVLDVYHINNEILSTQFVTTNTNLFDFYNKYLLKRHNKTRSSFLASVTCIDNNYTTISYSPVNTTLNSSSTDIKPIIWDPQNMKLKYMAQRKRELTLAAIFFIPLLFGIFVIAGFWDIYVTHKENNKLYYNDDMSSPLFPAEQPPIPEFNYSGGEDEGLAMPISLSSRIKRHLTMVALASSPFRNFLTIFKIDLSPFDNLPRKYHFPATAHFGDSNNGHPDDNTTQQNSFLGGLPTSTPLNAYSRSGKIDVPGKEQSMIPGLRALSLLWFLYANTYALSVPFVSNAVAMESSLMGFIGLTITGVVYVVDTALFISGYRTAQTLVVPGGESASAMLSSSGDLGSLLSWLYVFTYKYVRFTCLYAAVILYHTLVSPYWPVTASMGLPAGVYADLGGDYCRHNWWTNLLYVNNFVHSTRACLPWTWYVAVEAQLFLLAPPLIFLFKRSPTLSSVLVLHLTIAAIASSFALSFVNRYRSVFSINDPKFFPYFYTYFIRPYIRATPYLIGLLYGCYIYFYRNTTPYDRGDEDEELEITGDNDSGINNAIGGNDEDDIDILPSATSRGMAASSFFRIRRATGRLNRRTRKVLKHPAKRALIWLIMLIIMLAIVYGIKPEVRSLVNRVTDVTNQNLTNHNHNNNNDRSATIPSWIKPHWKRGAAFTPLTAAFYNTFSHVFWTLFILWIVWSCSRFTFATSTTRATGTARRTTTLLGGSGGITKRLLSAPCWIPISNLAFATYLIHPLVMYAYYSSLREPLYFTHSLFFTLFLASTFVSLGTALFASLTFEIPIINMARIYVTR